MRRGWNYPRLLTNSCFYSSLCTPLFFCFLSSRFSSFCYGICSCSRSLPDFCFTVCLHFFLNFSFSLSLFSGGIFTLRMSFPDSYPEKAPRVRFLTEMFHPNGIYVFLFSLFPFSVCLCIRNIVLGHAFVLLLDDNEKFALLAYYTCFFCLQFLYLYFDTLLKLFLYFSIVSRFPSPLLFLSFFLCVQCIRMATFVWYVLKFSPFLPLFSPLFLFVFVQIL